MLGYHHYSEDNIHSKIHVTLFIQMELCSLTLREYMQKRNTQCSSFLEFKTYAAANMRIFKQLVKGVDFIHTNGLIHRDLKVSVNKGVDFIYSNGLIHRVLKVSVNKGVDFIHSNGLIHRDLKVSVNKGVDFIYSNGLIHRDLKVSVNKGVDFIYSNGLIHRDLKVSVNKGVDFIYSNGLIHRDLKPRNIFLQGHQLHVKIGDFGLAKDDLRNSGREDALLTPSPLESPDKFYWDTHTTGVGTSTYGAPEQLQGSVYTNKSDIYSLGVILYELFHWFKTDMEKYKCLELLRQGEIDAQIIQHWPEQAKAVIQMTNSAHSDRPTTKELLQSELFLTKEQIILEMQTKIDDQASEIQKLKDMLKERDVQVEILTSSLTLEKSRLPHRHKKKEDKT
ncbi:EIF2AK1 [Mytilus coruscus]|uniref:non-specific serine/threonine protein kinase n=1 Tax=Mytilus coruscus TaxID=42192 RepID=A0A6J8D7C1_MYTCO|nr:EIF2AK1 [Mytilus coruscus]